MQQYKAEQNISKKVTRTQQNDTEQHNKKNRKIQLHQEKEKINEA